MTDKQKEALKVLLELHHEGDISAEQFVTVVDAIVDSIRIETVQTPTITSTPWWPRPYDVTWQTLSAEAPVK